MNTIGRRACIALVALAAGVGAGACTDLTVEPQSTVTGANVFTDASAYRSFLAKLYAGLAVTGQQGPAGEPDIEGIDEGFSQYIRAYWQLQELPTDEAVITWGDPGIPELVTSQWGSSNAWTTAMYYRIYFQVALANEFLRETAPDVLDARGHGDLAEIDQFRAEARALRALSYWHALDFYRNVPLVLEDYQAGDPPPEQATAEEMFAFIESELTEVEGLLPAVGQAQYGRIDQGVVAMILAKLYMNAEAYGVGARYGEAMTQVERVIAGPYALDESYRDLFLADNHTSPEMIFAVPFDGERTQTWGGMTFLAHAAVGGPMNAADYGLDGGWWGLSVPQQVVALYENGDDGFQEGEERPDMRSQIFYTTDMNFVINDFRNFFDGYALPKYSNVTSTGAPGTRLDFPDTDFPLFRLADAYLMHAELCLRMGGGGCEAQALEYVNQIRQRAFGEGEGMISADELTLQFVLNERARELVWEGHRRQDLVRFDQFTGGEYLWAFKGGAATGAAIEGYRDVYPIPAQELLANPNLDQNAGY